MTKEEFKSCYDQYFDPIRRFLYYKSGNMELSTDLSQEVFLKVWEKGLLFDPKATKSLLYRMANFHFVDFVRKNKLRQERLESLSFRISAEGPAQDLQYQELKATYERTLTTLPEKQREVFLMSRVEGLTYKEIAERLELSVKAVEKRMSQALAELKKKIGTHERK